MGANKKSKLWCESHVTECITETEKMMRKRKKERDIWEREKKYEYV
jgi:hypothetical protein